MNFTDDIFLKNPYGRRNGKLITIHDLSPKYDRGLDCNCECPQCKAPLLAKMGEKRTWHFAHSGDGCDEEKLVINSAYEIAKDAIESCGFIYTPDLYLRYINHGYTRDTMQVYRSNMAGYGYELVQSASRYTVQQITIEADGAGLYEALIVETSVGKIAVTLSIQTDYCLERHIRPYKTYPTVSIDLGRSIYLKGTDAQYEMIVCNSKKAWLHIPKEVEYIEMKLAEDKAAHDEAQQKQKEQAEQARIQAEENAARLKKEAEEARQKEAEQIAAQKAAKQLAKDEAVTNYLTNHPKANEFYERLKNAERISVVMFSHQSDGNEKQLKREDKISSIKVNPSKFQIIVATERKGDLTFGIKEMNSDNPVKLRAGGLYRIIDISNSEIDEVMKMNEIILQ